jgi:hypothetical protein
MTPERALHNDIVKAINSAPLGAWAVSNIVLMKRRANCAEVTGLGTGSPDIWVCIAPYGMQIWLEVKLPEPGSSLGPRAGQLSPEQKAWHAQAAKHGVLVFVVRSVQEALQRVMETKAAWVNPVDRKRICHACGGATRLSTAGCDHCDLEDQ